jgi:hypothetical protein
MKLTLNFLRNLNEPLNKIYNLYYIKYSLRSVAEITSFKNKVNVNSFTNLNAIYLCCIEHIYVCVLNDLFT